MTPSQFESNRRFHPFRKPRRTVQAVLDLMRRDQNLIASTLNVSEQGACVVLTAALPAGRQVSLVVEDHSCPQPVCLPGVVAWCERVGVQWVTSVRFQEHLRLASTN
jgi:hypothetical protein